ncbi:MAG TPA: hypothetical protein VHB27_13575 [Rhodopila sp.]|uniref:hypothetical protein n=1 Tax=Rhodopila sp. TaxID=2480087 RepID=UPI002B544515|nr:hypothetical protein [Rhodopila sp.]HVY16249.1 hypothetical protein [Rhodopila sp.]
MRRPSTVTSVLACLLMLAAVAVGPVLAASPAPTVWPHTITVNNASVTVYQPQAMAWPDHEVLTARAAIAVTPAAGGAPVLGTIELKLKTRTDPTGQQVSLSDPELVSSHFPALDTEAATRLDGQIRSALPTVQMNPVAVDSILLSLKGQAEAATVEVKNDPPVIFVSDKPASLVVFDGDPVLAPVGKTGLSFAMNTNWEVFSDGHAWYLLNDGTWFRAPAFSGPYTPTTQLPPAFSALPHEDVFAPARKAVPPSRKQPASIPAIFVSTKPAEIIVTQGPPQFAPVPGTTLQSVKNTGSTLFFQPSGGTFYLLVSGRWFSAKGLDGPWTFATDHLPPDFAMIPPKAPQAAVLPSVPGTAQAQLAVLQAQVPHQATLPKTVKVKVVYAGPPQFKPIPGTPLTYAVNTTFQVIETGGKYYVCYQGAWFVGPSPNGPWVLAESVPPVIYAIPPSSPLYPVTYVKVYTVTPTAVTYGYTAGYVMGYASAGVIVYGTGYYYPPVVIPGPVPVYYPYPYSYAGNVWYNSTTGAWARGGTIYGPYGGVATGGTYYNPNNGAWGRAGAIYGPNGGVGGFSYYNPSTGGYAHGSASWSNGSGYAQASYYNPHTGVSGSTQQNFNPYSRWGSSTFTGPNQTVNTKSGSNAHGSAGGFSSSTGAEGAGYRGVNGNKGGVAKTQNGDVYAGHDGNVYQHSSDGWSKWNNGGWQPVNPPSRTSPQGTNIQGTNTQGANTLGGTQGAKQGGTQSGANRTTRSSLDTSSYNQLEQDRQARNAGRYGGSRYGSGGYGGRFGGGEGGGRFRR